jgi:hypothetical protein
VVAEPVERLHRAAHLPPLDLDEQAGIPKNPHVVRDVTQRRPEHRHERLG